MLILPQTITKLSNNTDRTLASIMPLYSVRTGYSTTYYDGMDNHSREEELKIRAVTSSINLGRQGHDRSISGTYRSGVIELGLRNLNHNSWLVSRCPLDIATNAGLLLR